jgi:hypothetical protein
MYLSTIRSFSASRSLAIIGFVLLLSFPGCARPLQIHTEVRPAQRVEGPIERRPEQDIVVADVVQTKDAIEVSISTLHSCVKTTLERQEIVTHRKREIGPERVVLQVASILAGSWLLYSFSKLPEQPDGGNHSFLIFYGVGLAGWC